MEEKYVRCEAWNTVCCVDSLSNCFHRIPHKHNSCCDGMCGEVSRGCIPGSFNMGDRYRLFGNIIKVIGITEEGKERAITVEGEGSDPLFVLTTCESILIKILSKQIGV